MAQRSRKRFGQHFLHDRNIIERILNAVDPKPGDRLLEIGPGRGAMTYPLLRRCGELIAVELDRDLVPQLEAASAALGRLELINADILEVELARLPPGGKFRLLGNLPYNISTPLMFHMLQSAELIEDMHFMLQKEVAQRIVANPGESSYGRLSVMLQLRCDCHYLFDVAPGCFTPPPRVESAVVRLLPLAAPRFETGDSELFAAIVKSAFGQRRKTIGNSLKALLERDTISRCGIDPGARAETLGVADFANLSRALSR